MPHAPDDLALRLRRAAERCSAALREALEGAGLGDLPAGGWPLLCLVLERESLTSGEAAELLGVTPAAVSQTVSTLSRVGYLRENTHPGDARVHVLRTGPRAVERHELLRDFRRNTRAAWADVLGNDGTTLLGALSAVETALERESLSSRAKRLS